MSDETERDRDARVQGLFDPPFDHERRDDLCHTCSHALCETVLWAECYGKRGADR